MGMVSEFKQFIKRGNVLDLAVGVIIGAAFGKVVSSVTDDLLMPIISLVAGSKALDFSGWYIPLAGQSFGMRLDEAKALGAVLTVGNFISATINFLIVAFVIFIIVKQVNRLLPPPPPPPPPAGPPPTEVYLKEIRDALVTRKA